MEKSLALDWSRRGEEIQRNPRNQCAGCSGFKIYKKRPLYPLEPVLTEQRIGSFTCFMTKSRKPRARETSTLSHQQQTSSPVVVNNVVCLSRVTTRLINIFEFRPPHHQIQQLGLPSRASNNISENRFQKSNSFPSLPQPPANSQIKSSAMPTSGSECSTHALTPSDGLLQLRRQGLSEDSGVLLRLSAVRS
jgi:hypothetical protein